MSKGKSPRKRKAPTGTEVTPQPVPIPVQTPEPRLLALDDLARVIRQVVGAVLDLADRAAEVISKRMEGRA